MATKTPSPTTPAANTSSGGRNIANCKARLCDPDRDVVSGTAREEDSAGSVYLLNKFMLDLSLYEEAITRYKARRFLLMNGYNYTALELCGQGPGGYFSGLEWEQIALVSLQHFTRSGGDELKEYFCPDCDCFHGFHIL